MLGIAVCQMLVKSSETVLLLQQPEYCILFSDTIHLITWSRWSLSRAGNMHLNTRMSFQNAWLTQTAGEACKVETRWVFDMIR